MNDAAQLTTNTTTTSNFSIAYTEVTFTMYKSLFRSISSSKDVSRINTPVPCTATILETAGDWGEDTLDCGIDVSVTGIEHRGWANSTLSNLLSDEFMATLICGHFHIQLGRDSKFRVEARDVFLAKESDLINEYGMEESISSIECTVFRNGYIAMVVRLRIESGMDVATLLDWVARPDMIRKPDAAADLPSLYKSSITDLEDRGIAAGKLNVLAYYLAFKLDPVVAKAVRFLEIEDAVSQKLAETSGEYTGPIRKPWGNWSRPYVGILYRGVPENNAEGSITLENVQKLVVASGRTTREFYKTFVSPKTYLGQQDRNAYGPGGSIVFIASRGWSVWDGGNHNRTMFRLGVVEMTHFVIMALETSLRSRRRFVHEMQTRGRRIIRLLVLNITSELNQQDIRSNDAFADEKQPSIPRKVRRRIAAWLDNLKYRRIRRTADFVGECFATAPLDDGAMVLISHLKTHSARSAARRYATLKSFEATDKAVRDVLTHYVAALNSAIGYLQSPNYLFGVATIVVTIASVLFGVIAWVIRLSVPGH